MRQLQQPDLLEDVAGALDASGLDPGELMLEITESVLAADQQAMLERLAGLRALGVHLAIDDFGTGYSSLAYLKHLPVDTLKLAKPFVDGLLLGPSWSASAAASARASTSPAPLDQYAVEALLVAEQGRRPAVLRARAGT